MLRDSFGRTFPYIKLSITDVCNFKCGYCLPNGYQKDKSDNRTFLATEEIERLAKGLSELGVCKIRLTGGEPTVRKDFFDIVKIIKSNSGIKKTVITTNGYRLDQIANQIVDSGLDGINISIDSLNRETFKKITSHDRLPEILKGIEKLQQLNFKNIKIINNDIFNIIENKNLGQNIIVFGNLPYNISTQILASLVLLEKWPPWYEILIFMFQKEVADRILAKKNIKDF